MSYTPMWIRLICRGFDPYSDIYSDASAVFREFVT